MAKVALLLAGLFGLGCGTFPIGGAGNVPSLANLGQNNFLATLCATFQNRLPICSSLGALPTGRSLERTFGGAGNVQSPLNLGSTPGQVNNILATICATLQNRLPICSSLGALPTGRSLGQGTFPILGGAGNTPSLANLGQNNFLTTLCAT